MPKLPAGRGAGLTVLQFVGHLICPLTPLRSMFEFGLYLTGVSYSIKKIPIVSIKKLLSYQ